MRNEEKAGWGEDEGKKGGKKEMSNVRPAPYL